MTVCAPAAAADVAGSRRSMRYDELMSAAASFAATLPQVEVRRAVFAAAMQQAPYVRTTRALRADERGRERDHLRDFFFARVAVFGSPAAARFAAFLSESISARADSRCLWAALPRAFNIDCSRGILRLPP